MVNRLVAVDDEDYRLPLSVRGALATDLTNPSTELGVAVQEGTRPRFLGLQPPPLRNVRTITATTEPRPLEVFDGYVWGNVGPQVWRRPRTGGTWTLHKEAVGENATPLGLIPTTDGEVLSIFPTGLYKSTGWLTETTTWTKKVSANGVTYFLRWGVDGDGSKLIATTYAATTGFPDSRYVWLSTNAGNTWTIVYDAVARYGQAEADLTHLHAVCYDRWADRFYVSEGHGPYAGIYWSEDDGVTWTRAPGMVSNPSPVVIIATDTGLVCGSDADPNGVLGVTRNADPNAEQLVMTWKWVTGRDGLIGFAQRGFRDPDTGVVYIGFRSNFPDVQPVIAAGTPTSGGLLYTWPSGGVGADDRVFNVVVPTSNELLATAAAGSTITLIEADVSVPGVTTLPATGNLTEGAAKEGTSIALGSGSTVDGLSSTAVGVKAKIGTNQSSVAVGFASEVVGSNATVVGAAAKGGANSVAIGANSQSGTLANLVLIGRNTSAAGGGSGVAIGHAAAVRADGVSVGENAASLAGSSGGVALGKGAQAGNRGVALGKDSITTADDQVQVGGRHIELAEVSSVAQPPVDRARLYIEDNGAGKTRLMVRFRSGAAQVVATEP